MANIRSYHPVTAEAARLLGAEIRAARIERGWTLTEFADRVGVTHVTARKIERGDPSVGLGLAFDAAVLAAVPLFFEDRPRLALETARAEEKVALLPRRVRPVRDIDDAF